MKNLYSLENICLDYPLAGDTAAELNRVRALNNLGLEIYKGEFLTILGANGSGKSSLGKLLAGLADDFSGLIYYKDRNIESYRRDIFGEVTMVLQEPQNQLLMPTVAEELAYPLKNRGLSPDEIARRVEEYADLFGLNNLMENSPDELSGGEITTVAMASSLIVDPEVIILDEPDSHFDSDRKSVLDKLIRVYRRRKTIILITQYIEQAKSSDRIIILKDGTVVSEGKPADILTNEVLLDECGLSSIHSVEKPEYSSPAWNTETGEPIIELCGVNFTYDLNKSVLKNIDLKICSNEKVGLMGKMGSGKSTLGLILAGLMKPDSGTIAINGKSVDNYSEKELRRIITMSMQFPERALFEETVADDVSFGPRNLANDNIERTVTDNLQFFSIENLRLRHPLTLSGGEKRKAALAGILAMNPEIAIFDEPTAALDPKSYKDLMLLLRQMKDKTLMIISHDATLLKNLCTRIIELRGGSIISDKTTS